MANTADLNIEIRDGGVMLTFTQRLRYVHEGLRSLVCMIFLIS